MKKRNRRLIEWIPITRKDPYDDLNHEWQWHKNKIKTIINIWQRPKHKHEFNANMLINAIMEVFNAANVFENTNSDTWFCWHRNDVRCSLRFISSNFDLIEFMLNSSNLIINSERDYIALSRNINNLREVGFNLPKITERLMLYKLKYEPRG